MGLGQYLARKGAIGGTARWVVDAFFGALANDVININDCSTQEGLDIQIDNIVKFSLAIRFQNDPTHFHANEIYKFFLNGGDKGLLGFTIAILAVEAGYYKNTASNMAMFDEIISEELRAKKVGEAIINGIALR